MKEHVYDYNIDIEHTVFVESLYIQSYRLK
jgi:hypothetical protein